MSLQNYRSYRSQGSRTDNPRQLALDELTVGNMQLLGKMTGQLQWNGNVVMKAPDSIDLTAPAIRLHGACEVTGLSVTDTPLQTASGVAWSEQYTAEVVTNQGLTLSSHPPLNPYPVGRVSGPPDRPIWLGAPTQEQGGWYTQANASHLIHGTAGPVAGHQWVTSEGQLRMGATGKDSSRPEDLQSFVAMDPERVAIQASVRGRIDLDGRVDHRGERLATNHSIVTAREPTATAPIGWQAGAWDSATHDTYTPYAQLLAEPQRLSASVGARAEIPAAWTVVALGSAGASRMQVGGGHGSGMEDVSGASLRCNGDPQPTALRLTKIGFVRKDTETFQCTALAARGSRLVGVVGTHRLCESTIVATDPWTFHADPNNQRLQAVGISDRFAVVGGSAYACHVSVATGSWVQVLGWPADALVSAEETIHWVVAGSRHFSLLSKAATRPEWIVRDVSWPVGASLPPSAAASTTWSIAGLTVSTNVLSERPKGDVIAVAGEDAGPWVSVRVIPDSGKTTLTWWSGASELRDLEIPQELAATDVQAVALGGRRFVVQYGQSLLEVDWASDSLVTRTLTAGAASARAFPWTSVSGDWGWVAHDLVAQQGVVAGEVVRRAMDADRGQKGAWDSWVANDRMARWWAEEGLDRAPRWVGMVRDHQWVWMQSGGRSVGVLSTSMWKRAWAEPAVLEVDGVAKMSGGVQTDRLESEGNGDVVLYGEQDVEDIHLGKKAKKLWVECPVYFQGGSVTTTTTTAESMAVQDLTVSGSAALPDATTIGKLGVTKQLTMGVGSTWRASNGTSTYDTDTTTRTNGSWTQTGGAWMLDNPSSAQVSGNFQVTGGWLTVDGAKVRTLQGVPQVMSVATTPGRWHVVGGWVSPATSGRNAQTDFRRSSAPLTAGVWIVGFGRLVDATASDVSMVRLEIGARTVGSATGCWQLSYWGSGAQAVPPTAPVTAVGWINVNAADTQTILALQTSRAVEWQWTVSSWVDGMVVGGDGFQIATSNFLNVPSASADQVLSKVVSMDVAEVRRQLGTTSAAMVQMLTNAAGSGQWSVLTGGTSPVGVWKIDRSTLLNQDSATLTLGNSSVAALTVKRPITTDPTAASSLDVSGTLTARDVVVNGGLLTQAVNVRGGGLVITDGGQRIEKGGLQVKADGLSVEGGVLTVAASGGGVRVNNGGLVMAAPVPGGSNPLTVNSPATFASTVACSGVVTLGSGVVCNGGLTVNGAAQYTNTVNMDQLVTTTGEWRALGTVKINKHLSHLGSRAGLPFRGPSTGWYSIGKFRVTTNLNDFPTIQLRFVGAQGTATVFTQFGKLDLAGTVVKVNRQFYVEQLDGAETTAIFDRVGWLLTSIVEMELFVRTTSNAVTGSWFADTFCGTFDGTNALTLENLDVVLPTLNEASLSLLSRSMRFSIDTLNVQSLTFPRMTNAASTPWNHIATLNGSWAVSLTQKCLLTLIGGSGSSNAATAHIMITLDNSITTVAGWYYLLGGTTSTVEAFVADVMCVLSAGVVQVWVQIPTANSAFSVQAVPTGIGVSFSGLLAARASAPVGGVSLTPGWETRGDVKLGGSVVWPLTGTLRASNSLTTQLQNPSTGTYYSAWSVTRDKIQYIDAVGGGALFRVESNGNMTVNKNVLLDSSSAALIGQSAINIGLRNPDNNNEQYTALSIVRDASTKVHELQVMNTSGTAPVARLSSTGNMRVGSNVSLDSGGLYLNDAGGGGVQAKGSLTVNLHNGTAYQSALVVSTEKGVEVKSSGATTVSSLDTLGNFQCAKTATVGEDLVMAPTDSAAKVCTTKGLLVQRKNAAGAYQSALSVGSEGLLVYNAAGTVQTTLDPAGGITCTSLSAWQDPTKLATLQITGLSALTPITIPYRVSETPSWCKLVDLSIPNVYVGASAKIALLHSWIGEQVAETVIYLSLSATSVKGSLQNPFGSDVVPAVKVTTSGSTFKVWAQIVKYRQLSMYVTTQNVTCTFPDSFGESTEVLGTATTIAAPSNFVSVNLGTNVFKGSPGKYADPSATPPRYSETLGEAVQSITLTVPGLWQVVAQVDMIYCGTPDGRNLQLKLTDGNSAFVQGQVWTGASSIGMQVCGLFRIVAASTMVTLYSMGSLTILSSGACMFTATRIA